MDTRIEHVFGALFTLEDLREIHRKPFLQGSDAEEEVEYHAILDRLKKSIARSRTANLHRES